MARFRPPLKNGLIQDRLAKLAKNFYPACPEAPAVGIGMAPADGTEVKSFFMLSGTKRIYPGHKAN